MTAMDPLRHASLLQQMGVEWYVPRGPIANASTLPTQLLVPVAADPQPQATEPAEQLSNAVVEPISEPSGEASPAPSAGASAALEQVAASLAEVTDAVRVVPDPVSPTPAAESLSTSPDSSPTVSVGEQLAPFNLYVVAFPGAVAFVCGIKTERLSAVWEQSAKAFMEDIARSLGMAAMASPRQDYFCWPLAGQARMTASDGRAVTAGFLQGILADCKPNCVFLMGETAQQFGQGSELGNDTVRLISTPTLGQLFSRPELKAEIWRQCQGH